MVSSCRSGIHQIYMIMVTQDGIFMKSFGGPIVLKVSKSVPFEIQKMNVMKSRTWFTTRVS